MALNHSYEQQQLFFLYINYIFSAWYVIIVDKSKSYTRDDKIENKYLTFRKAD